MNKELEKLLDLLIAKESANQKKQAESVKARGVCSYADGWEWVCLQYNRQTSCPHLKGWCSNRRPIGTAPGSHHDYNISKHTFPTGESRIKCLCGCGWEVWDHPGWSYKWAVGMKMAESSTNTPSCSEITGEKYLEVARQRR